MFNYKKLIKSRSTRIKILHLFDFIPDKLMLQLQYFIKMGRKLNLKKPQRYTEKLQWYKLFYRDPLMKQCVDKYDVRQYVEKCGLKEILNECYGVFDCVEDIDFNKLPNSFVLKDTLGSGGNDIIIVKDKKELNIAETIKRMKEWIAYPYKGKHPGREWVYENKRHRIVVEKNLLQLDVSDLPDYKFFCFNGQIFCSYFMQNYTFHHDDGQLGFFDKNFKMLPFHRSDFLPITSQPSKPRNYEQMCKYAEILAKPFPHVRVDFYNLNGKIIFGELTFFMASGYLNFEPDEFDFMLGNKFLLSDRKII